MPVDSWSPTLTLERFELLRRVWALLDEEGQVIAPQLRLRPDRRVACGVEEWIDAWDVRGDTLVLLDRAGIALASFDEVEEEEGRTVFRGTRRDASNLALGLRDTDPIEHWPAPADRHPPQPRDELRPRRHLLVTASAGYYAEWERDLDDENRSWDLCLLGAGDPPPDEWEPPEYEANPRGDGRWAALHTLLYPGSPLGRYDHVAFADRCVRWSWAALNEAFAVAHAHDLLLAHPAISADGDIPERFHSVFDRRLGFGTPVELLCPIFSAEALRVCAPTFALAPAGSRELAQLWTALLGTPLNRIAVIDDMRPITLAPTRPTPPATPELLARYGLAPDTRDAGALLWR